MINCCLRCAEENEDRDPDLIYQRIMICCPKCGNKRCPRATWHQNECSGSNEPGQQGSRQ